jgi:putative ABC transport system substrate-binding protein
MICQRCLICKVAFSLTVSAGWFVLSVLVHAQQPKIIRLGYLANQLPSQAPVSTNSFRQGMQELGYVEGKTVVFEWRSADGKPERYPALAAELVELRVDVIVAAGGTPGMLAAKQATSTIPIVFTGGSDLVALGVIASHSRPGGNVTGVSLGGPELYGKRLELLKQTVPRLSRVGYLRNPDNPAARFTSEEIIKASRALAINIETFDVRSANEIKTAFTFAKRAQVSGLVVAQTAPFSSGSTGQTAVVNLARTHRLPAIYAESNWPTLGGLMSYSTDTVHVYKRTAVLVDKIIKGAKPADLPVEQPTKFELVINLKTAKQIGLTIPPNVLARADRVIR